MLMTQNVLGAIEELDIHIIISFSMMILLELLISYKTGIVLIILELLIQIWLKNADCCEWVFLSKYSFCVRSLLWGTRCCEGGALVKTSSDKILIKMSLREGSKKFGRCRETERQKERRGEKNHFSDEIRKQKVLILCFLLDW
jgi:hypothetical protein